MSRPVLALVATLALTAGPVLLGAAPAAAAAVFVEVNPSTIERGGLVGIRASCEKNDAPATVESVAFGKVTVQPQHGFLTSAATVPDNRAARSYPVRLTCPDGRTATTTLHVVGQNRPTRGPASGFGGTAGGDVGPLMVGVGLLVIAAGAGLGLLALRRRHAG